MKKIFLTLALIVTMLGTCLFPVSAKADETVQICSSCGHEVETGVWNRCDDTFHRVMCLNCGHVLDIDSHKFEYKYLIEDSADYVTNGMQLASSHWYVKICTVCGYTQKILESEHNFVNNVCKDCGYEKVIGPKTVIKSATGKYVKTTTVYTPANWYWYVNRWYYTPAGKYPLYYYNINLKWNKSAGAKAYVVSTEKLTAGEAYVQGSVHYTLVKGSKRSMTYPIKSKTKLKSIKIYIAQVNADGVIGKVTSKKVTF